METRTWEEKLIEQEVTYTLLKDGRFYIIERVPARVNVETGEQFFSPQTVERLQHIIWEEQSPMWLTVNFQPVESESTSAEPS